MPPYQCHSGTELFSYAGLYICADAGHAGLSYAGDETAGGHGVSRFPSRAECYNFNFKLHGVLLQEELHLNVGCEIQFFVMHVQFCMSLLKRHVRCTHATIGSHGGLTGVHQRYMVRPAHPRAGGMRRLKPSDVASAILSTTVRQRPQCQ